MHGYSNYKYSTLFQGFFQKTLVKKPKGYINFKNFNVSSFKTEYEGQQIHQF